MFYACAFNCRNILCCLISFSGRVYSIFFMRINDFCMYMRFIVSLRWKGKGMKMKDKEMLQIWLRLKEEAAYERGVLFTLDEIIRRCGLESFPVDSDGFVLRVEQIEGICEDIRSRYLDADFHV